jgi:WD40 repeat protein
VLVFLVLYGTFLSPRIILDGIMSLEWSASSEWILMSGGCDGAIRFWDIRRAGCFRVLDQSRSQLGKRPLVKSALYKVCSLSLLLSIIFVFVMRAFGKRSYSLHSKL